MCRAVKVLGEHCAVPVVAVGGLVLELTVTAGSGCAALGQLREGAVEGLQSRLGWVSSGCAWGGFPWDLPCVCCWLGAAAWMRQGRTVLILEPLKGCVWYL